MRNGIPLSKIHHAAFDAHLIGIDPDYRLHVSERLLAQNDGPMLEAIKDWMGGCFVCRSGLKIALIATVWLCGSSALGLRREALRRTSVQPRGAYARGEGASLVRRGQDALYHG